VSAVNREGWTIWIVDAHRSDAAQKLTETISDGKMFNAARKPLSASCVRAAISSRCKHPRRKAGARSVPLRAAECRIASADRGKAR
jgi:hypothetical protein